MSPLSFFQKKLQTIVVHRKNLSKYMLSITIYCLTLFALYIICVPKFLLGNLFFGQVSYLYNATFAKFFYMQSIHYDQEQGFSVPFAHYQLARVYFIQGDLEKAIVELRTELAIYPTHYHVYYIQGLVYGYMERYSEAIDSFEKYIEANPKTWAGRNDKAWLEFRIGDIDSALATIKPAYDAFPDNPWVLNTYGALLMNKGDLIKAETILRKGLQAAEALHVDGWGQAYPGNDPRVYSVGLSAMKNSFKQNLLLIEEKRGQAHSVDKKI